MSKMGDEYNKRLEASAHDLLEALKQARFLIRHRLPACHTHLDIINKAIAKVEGKDGKESII